MRHSAPQAAVILNRVESVLKEQHPDDYKLQYLWVTMAYIHAMVLAKRLQAHFGNTVQSGPFKGMQLTPAAMSGAFAPYLLGTYEHELHPFIEKAIAENYAQIINIGCAWGYYAIGLALRLPNAAVHAFDIEKICQDKCRETAKLNGVESRVQIGGAFKGEDFAAYADQKTLAIVDIESAEVDLLDPARWPALQKMDFIVELHDLFRPGVTPAIRERFAPTHDLTIVRNRAELFDFAALVGEEAYVDPFDSLLVRWENRDGPTPWAVMKSKTVRGMK